MIFSYYIMEYQHCENMQTLVNQHVSSAPCIMLQNPSSVRHTEGFNATEQEKFIHMVSESTVQQTFKKLSPAKFWCSIKKEYPQLCERLPKHLFPLPRTRHSHYCKQSNASCQTECRSRQQNPAGFHEARYQREMQKYKTVPQFL